MTSQPEPVRLTEAEIAYALINLAGQHHRFLDSEYRARVAAAMVQTALEKRQAERHLADRR
jgi:hypothetical protein